MANYKSVEELAKGLSSDPEFSQLPESQQNAVFDELVKRNGLNVAPENPVANMAGNILTNPLGIPSTKKPDYRRAAEIGGAVAGGMAGEALFPVGPAGAIGGAGLGAAAGRGLAGFLQGETPQVATSEATGAGLRSAALTGIGGAVFKAVPEVWGAFSRLGGKTGAQFAEDVAGQYGKYQGQIGKEFGEGITNLATKYPENSVNLEPLIQNLQRDMVNNPQLASELRTAVSTYQNRFGKDILTPLIEDSSLAKSLPPIEAQHIINTLEHSPSVYGKLGTSSVEAGAKGALKSYIEQAKDALGEAFPEGAVSPVRQAYGAGKENISNVKPFFEESKNVIPTVNRAMRRGAYESPKRVLFGNPVLEKSAKEVLGDDLYNALHYSHNAAQVRRYIPYVLAALGIGEGGRRVLRWASGQ